MNLSTLYIIITALFTLVKLTNAFNAQLFVGTLSSTFAGDGLTISSSATSISARSYQITFNTLNSDMYYLERDVCRIRKVVYYRGLVSTLAGTGSCSDYDGAIPGIASLTYASGLRFHAISSTQVWLLLVVDSHQMRTVDLQASTLNTFTGSTSVGSVVNVVRTSARYNTLKKASYHDNIIFMAENGNNGRIVRLSRITNIVTVLASQITSCMSVAPYRAYVFSGQGNKIYKTFKSTGITSVFSGSGAYGNNVAVGGEQYGDIFDLIADCQRKSLFTSEFNGNVVKEFTFATSTVKHIAGVFSVSSYNGPGPMVSTIYQLYGVAGVSLYDTKLYIACYSQNNIAMVQMDTPGGMCNLYTTSKTITSVKNPLGTAIRYSGIGSATYAGDTLTLWANPSAV
eukprot:PhF_6_TR2597/c0_g1_i1/m.4388